MATVYVATDLRLERRVALKVMHGHLSDDAVFQSRFIQEARAAARLANPHVVNVFDQGQDAGLAYLVMEYLPGITLRELLREQRRLTVPQAVTIMDATLAGLAAAHEASIVHRDVKPENILLAEDGRIKIGDFGLARATTANTATGQLLMGTIAYLAPELVTRGTADARSDIYALGIMLYEMLTGEQPDKGEQPMQIAYQHATDSVPRPSVRNPGVPALLDDLVLWATAREPDDRPRDAAQMLEELRRIERELGISPVVTASPGLSTRPAAPDEATEPTKVLTALAIAPAAAAASIDNATRLRRAAARRRARGGWLIALVLALTALAAGTGWWFGSGPGSMVTVPGVRDLDFASAQQALAQQSLVAVRGQVYDISVPVDRAVRTDPGQGARVDKGRKVTVLLSLGPAPQTVGRLSGMPQAQAKTTITGLHLKVGDVVRIFGAAPAETVVSATLAPRAGGSVDCSKGCAAHEGDTMALTVSAGPLPDVAGLSVGDATDALHGAGLAVSDTPKQAYSSTVTAGQVIGLADRDGGGPWHPHDTVTLIVSKGPQPVTVPSVKGMTVHQAYTALQQAGFVPITSLDGLPIWDFFAATGTDPAAGTLQLPGTKVKILAQGF